MGLCVLRSLCLDVGGDLSHCCERFVSWWEVGGVPFAAFGIQLQRTKKQCLVHNMELEEDSKTMLRNQGKVSIRGKCVQPIEEDSSHIDRPGSCSSK
ncbi:uncharacterized protein LOC143644587 isoform X2 [Tamandua tetradactyla]|uniref:uncharacterized protein LOC143644587 isoform X2 n=1 Tax=Tamandua tetradactyla TaxID=48850 RepID=UPI0040546746